jgi:exodeoxyribonuclease-5
MAGKFSVGSSVALSDEQRQVFEAVLRNLDADQVQTVGGYAGTGKTVLVGALADRLPSYATCAYTGKAAHVLRKKGVIDARTIHATIYVPIERDLTAAREHLKALRELFPDHASWEDVRQAEEYLRELETQPAFRLKEECELHADDGDKVGGFLVDESSMVSRELHDDLLSFGLPVVFVGDHGQLPPVGDSDVYLMADPDHRLETIHRNAGPIARFAEHLRKGGHARAWKGTGNEVHVLSRGAVTDKLLLSADQVIHASNRERVAMNRRVRNLLGRTALLEKDDRVICLRNSRERGLFNGMQGVVSRLAGVEMDFVDDDGTAFQGVEFDPGQFGQQKYAHRYGGPHPFDYGYCVTGHKAQGSEWPHVLAFEPSWRGDYWEHERWTYTAASRARERLTWVV